MEGKGKEERGVEEGKPKAAERRGEGRTNKKVKEKTSRDKRKEKENKRSKGLPPTLAIARIGGSEEENRSWRCTHT